MADEAAMAPPSAAINDRYRVPKPKSLKEAPGYVKKLVSQTCGRMFYILKLIWEANKGILFFMSFMTLFSGVSPVIGSLIGKEILNALVRAYSGELTDFHLIAALLILNFAYLLLDGAINRVYNTVNRISGEVVANHIKVKIMSKAKDVDLASYDSPDYYSKLENANREAARRPIEVLSSAFSMISTLISIVSYIIVIAAVGAAPALLIIAVSIPSTVINFYFRRKNFDYLFRRSKARRQLNYYSDVMVNKDLVKEIRMLGLADTFIGKYNAVFKDYFKGLRRLMMQELLWTLLATLLSTAVNCVLFVMIARGVFRGEYEVGNYALYTGALNAISGGVFRLITTTASIYEGTLFINNMISFMGEEKKIVPTVDPPRPVTRGRHTVEFQNVSFRYPGTNRDVLHDISFTVEPSDSIVLVGLNGAGKTTLIKLLMRLYDPTGGVILLDGHDIREYDVSALYGIFGIVFQDYGKYAVSVKENISFGEIMKTPDQSAVDAAAAHANAKDFIEALPEGYDTPLMRYFEDEGTELSGGQWQKIAIARAFYSDSDILILDEPTASLDPLAEQEVFNQFETLRNDKSSIFVSHRLSSATTASKIVVLKDGTVSEIGSHRELMAKKGDYYVLFSTQAKRYVERDDPVGEPSPRRGSAQRADFQ